MTRGGRTKRRVLVVEDDAALRHGLTRLLEGAGYDVSAAKDGVEALEEVERFRPELMLLDVGLPRLNGLEVLERLSSQPQPPLVIVMTADDTPETLLQAVRGHAFDYIGKPFPPNEIPQLVARA